MKSKALVVLGIRGVPAQHGGFETFAEKLSLYLVERGWEVAVYCQEEGNGKIYESEWEGVKRIHIPVSNNGPLGTIIFDWRSVWHARKKKVLHLTLGYNTGCFNIVQRLFNITNVINMDGIEWKRQKWGKVTKAWFWLNERFSCWFGNALVADHPEIKAHLATRVRNDKIIMIPYGAPQVVSGEVEHLQKYGLETRNYSILIARAEPENSILEVVSAFSRKKRNHELVILGDYDPINNPYHKSVMDIASDEVKFLGAIYDQEVVGSLRFYAQLYVHGHQVGGTNPSLVEALGAGNAVLAHDNRFNRWVAGNAGYYFSDRDECEKLFSTILSQTAELENKRSQARAIFSKKFQWDDVLSQYEKLLLKQLKGRQLAISEQILRN